MEAPANEPFCVAKVDLDNFYHRIRLPEWLQPYFALPPVRAAEWAWLNSSASTP